MSDGDLARRAAADAAARRLYKLDLALRIVGSVPHPVRDYCLSEALGRIEKYEQTGVWPWEKQP